MSDKWVEVEAKTIDDALKFMAIEQLSKKVTKKKLSQT
jgi:hypothetical protein